MGLTPEEAIRATLCGAAARVVEQLGPEPVGELGVAEWDYFEAKSEKRVRKFALRNT